MGLLLGAQDVQAVPFVVNDSDFTGSQYTFSYFSTQNQSNNGNQAPVVGDPWLTNTGWTRFSIGGFTFWQNPPAGLGILFSGPSQAGTVGFDFSAVTGSIQKVELLTSNVLFQIPPSLNPGNIALRAEGDMVTGDVATPAAFGTGTFSNIYTLTGGGVAGGTNDLALGNGGDGNDGPGGVDDFNTRVLHDITSLLSPAWLAAPSLLELRFGFQQNPTGLDIFSDSAQVFRSLSTTTGTVSDNDLGMRLVVTLQSTSPAIPEPGTLALFTVGLAGLAFARRRRAA